MFRCLWKNKNVDEELLLVDLKCMNLKLLFLWHSNGWNWASFFSSLTLLTSSATFLFVSFFPLDIFPIQIKVFAIFLFLRVNLFINGENLLIGPFWHITLDNHLVQLSITSTDNKIILTADEPIKFLKPVNFSHVWNCGNGFFQHNYRWENSDTWPLRKDNLMVHLSSTNN